MKPTADAQLDPGRARQKYDHLVAHLRTAKRVAVAFSGGVDSSLLLHAAREAHAADAVCAIHARSPLYCSREREAARAIAEMLAVRLLQVDSDALDDTHVRHNQPDRCYHCKLHSFRLIRAVAREEGCTLIVEGCNVDDVDDYRPGMRAIRELGIESPLREAGLTKQEIRWLAREKGLPNWDEPAMACLASRIPYGREITADRLRRIDAAEEAVRAFGVRLVRVRDHGSVARIEVAPDAIARLLAPEAARALVARLRQLGFQHVALDLEGYRMGAMNASLPVSTRVAEAMGRQDHAR